MKKSKSYKKAMIEAEASKISEAEIVEVQQAYEAELETNPEYSLQVDPTDKYGLTDIHKKFIEYYVQFKSIMTAAELAGIDAETAKGFFVSYATQQEVRRINRAMIHRQYCTKMINLDEIGGYLTALLQDEVPYADRLKSTDKLRVVSMLLDVKQMKQQQTVNPNIINVQNITTEIKNLSVKTIQQLLAQMKMPDNQSKLEYEDTLTPEEKEYLQTLPTSELLKLIEDTNKKKENKDNE